MKRAIPLATVEAIEPKKRGVSDLLAAMGKTAYQGRTLAEAAGIWQEMLAAENLVVVMGLAGSLSTAGQWKLVRWLLEHRFVDVLVSIAMPSKSLRIRRNGAVCPAVLWRKP